MDMDCDLQVGGLYLQIEILGVENDIHKIQIVLENYATTYSLYNHS